MIADKLENAHRYYGLGPAMQAAFAFLQEFDAGACTPGQYEIDGERVYAQVQQYTTLPAGELQWEAHQKYIDVQLIAAGVEDLGYAADGALLNPGPYTPQQDIQFAGGVQDGAYLRRGAGEFVLFFAGEPHKPRCMAGAAGPVTKVVVKVAVDAIGE